jgi:voltage-gated potassium channel
VRGFGHDEPVKDRFRRVRIGLGALALMLVMGTVGYLLFGFDLLDAVYQTVITVTTSWGLSSGLRGHRGHPILKLNGSSPQKRRRLVEQDSSGRSHSAPGRTSRDPEKRRLRDDALGHKGDVAPSPA